MSISSWFSSGSPSSSSSSNSSTPASSPKGELTPAASLEPVVKASLPSNKFISEKNPQGIKPCCACPETKKARDDCFLKYGSNIDEDSQSKEHCKDIVERHRECMRGFGFNI